MERFEITGGLKLSGEVKAAGNKNAALPILAATLLTEEECEIENLPRIKDVENLLNLLKELGKRVEFSGKNSVKISGKVEKSAIGETAGKLRASILLVSPILSQFGEAEFPPPGGCVIGRRRIDNNLIAFSSLGAVAEFDGFNYKLKKKNKAENNVFLIEASVTATENILLGAALNEEELVIQNAASEPHIVDLAEALGKMGCEVQGAGTNLIKIKGAKKLSGFKHAIQPDFIEAGTFAIAAAATGGSLTIRGAERKYLNSTFFHLSKLGVNLSFSAPDILEVKTSRLKSNSHKARVGLYPGFPTDLMSPYIVLATQAEGVTLCHDWMYESRMFFVDKLIIMGAEITQCDPHRVLVYGPTKLRAQHLVSPDIRAGIALVIAAMIAEGESAVDHVEIIDRGYENIEKRLNKAGAKIKRVKI